MTSSSNSKAENAPPFELRLKLYFTLISCMGGLILASGTNESALSVVAIFFAVFGFVFVDWLEFFALPSVAAYAAMGVAAMFCVGDFVEMDAPGQHQMGVVAQLLILVQSILMLQKKNRRIFEQLGVFCLLELVVAAVFNDAILFGLLLLPITLIGAMALTLTTAIWVTEGQSEISSKKVRKKDPHRVRSKITVHSEACWEAIYAASPRLSRIVLWMLAPAVLLIAVFFFYALPRTTDAARVESRGNAMVGFSDELRLEQIGRMMRSTKAAMRIKLRRLGTAEPYTVLGGLYLRGRVLERYEDYDRLSMRGASWKSLPDSYLSAPEPLPAIDSPSNADGTLYRDWVDVKIVCESMRSNALFALAPYHSSETNSAIKHFPERWTLSREGKSDWIHPRAEYRFESHAFRDGSQSELKSFWHRGDPLYRQRSSGIENVSDRERQVQNYIRQLLIFNPAFMPTIEKIGEEVAEGAKEGQQSDYATAKAMERHFKESGTYQYTLNLNAEPVPGLDPIEQFVRIDQRGHCQYFASALAMMLRSQGIPARLVAGYHTDEYNNLARHYVARQLHAHAWVEALVKVEPGDVTPEPMEQSDGDRYWLRLDPTPAAARVRETGRTGQIIDLAQSVWDDYVVEMDSERQNLAINTGGSTSMNQSYQLMINRLADLVNRLRAGQLGGGALASRKWFSWQAATLAILSAIGIFLLIRLSSRLRYKVALQRSEPKPSVPSLEFYAQAISVISRLGISPDVGQTPKEFSEIAIKRLQSAGRESAAAAMSFLTELFYRSRYGNPTQRAGIAKVPKIVDASSVLNAHGLTPDSIEPSAVEDQSNRALAELSEGVEWMLQRTEKGN